MTKLRDYRVRHRQLLSHFDRVSEGASERRSRTVMVWPERGAGLSPLVAGCDHWTSPMDFAGADMGSERRRPLHDLLCNGDAGLCQQVVVRSLLIQEGEEGANVARG